MGTAVVVQDKKTLEALVTRMAPSMAQVLPAHLTPERMVKIVLVAASRQPKLYECTVDSIARAVMNAAELGLDCAGGVLGQGYLVPYWNNKTRALEAQFIPGYRGLIALARNTGEIATIEAHLVHERDRWHLAFGLAPVLEHEPCLEGDPGKFVFGYMLAVLTDGRKQVEVMTAADIEAIKQRTKSRDRNSGAIVGPWLTDEDEMRRKTVVRRGIKYLPLSIEKARPLERALEVDNEAIEPADIPVALASERAAEDRKARAIAAVEELKGLAPVAQGIETPMDGQEREAALEAAPAPEPSPAASRDVPPPRETNRTIRRPAPSTPEPPPEREPGDDGPDDTVGGGPSPEPEPDPVSHAQLVEDLHAVCCESSGKSLAARRVEQVLGCHPTEASADAIRAAIRKEKDVVANQKRR